MPKSQAYTMRSSIFWAVCAGLAFPLSSFGDDPPPPEVKLALTNNQKRLTWPPYPAAQRYAVQSAGDPAGPYSNDLSGIMSGYQWAGLVSQPTRFYRLAVTPMSDDQLLQANVLNRLAYGPTPDELERLAAPGAALAYIGEQLAPENLPVTFDSYVTVATNGVALPSNTNWTFVNVTGNVSSSTLYMYLTGVGSVYLDDVQLRLITTQVVTNGSVVTTNTVLGPNVLVNGDFEAPLTTGWTVSPNLAGSAIVNDVVCSGTGSLRMVATAAGSTQNSSIWQTVTPTLPTTRQRCVLSFAYFPTPNSRLLTLRLSGTGTIINAQNEPAPPTWVYATATGVATGNPTLYAYLNDDGEAYIDDIKLVAGAVPEAGPNLLGNGDFETGVLAPWQASADFINSTISTELSFSGSASLKLVATDGGGGNNDSVYQSAIPGVTNGGTYTVSYWYIPSTRNRSLTVRLSGSATPGLLVSSPDGTSASGLHRRLDEGLASLDNLRTWFCHQAVASPRQLLEILTQFFENHFVTQHSKSVDYFDRFYDEGAVMNRLAADLEYREISKWRQCLLNPNCTFYDLSEVSAESPAMIIYLDTVGSRGNGDNIANENYARELFELFCMGVDNGYDQNDIVAMSRAWTGWSVDIVDASQVNNPFAARSSNYGAYPGVGFNAVSNIIGVWSFKYVQENHGTNRAPILSEWDPNSPPGNPRAIGPKIVPARFGPPWAGQPYQLQIPRRTGNASIQDGYDVIRHLADLPFTMEYISVKLCRLFVHDDFAHGVYDYTDPNRSPEAELIRQCMMTWNTPASDGRKGNIRNLLTTIFNSELFRRHAGSMQKVKTPLEFCISAVRALRSANPNGTYTATTDGNFAPILSRMGAMSLFNRADPDGYPETGPAWISAGTLAERLRFVQTLCMNQSGRPNDAGNNTVDPVGLLKRKLPATSWNNASAVADYFLGILFPAEGQGNLTLYRNLAINFLSTGDSGTTSSPFSGLGNTSAAYDTRVRGMVAMLMTLQRFQEQ